MMDFNSLGQFFDKFGKQSEVRARNVISFLALFSIKDPLKINKSPEEIE